MSHLKGVTVDTYDITFGLDQELGWYYDVFIPEFGVMLEQKSTRDDQLTKEQLAAYLEGSLSVKDLIKYDAAIGCIKMDLDPQMGIGYVDE